jgi:uncharacterized protein
MQEFVVAQNRMIHVDGHDFIFLSGDKAIFEMDSFTKKALSLWSPDERFTREAFLSSSETPSGEAQDFFEGLLQRRAILPLNGVGLRKNALAEAGREIPLETMILHVTDACNLGCLYCYRSENGAPKTEGKQMTWAVAQRAIDYLSDHCGNREKVVVVFFGGEPLLNLKLMKSLSVYAREKLSERGKMVDFAMTTNGTVLTRDAIAFLEELNIGVTVSIDGFEEAHDRCRRFPDGSPSYRVIVPKVKELLAVLRRPVVARVTLVEHPERVPRILDHLLGIGFMEVGFSPVTTGNPDYQLSSRDMDLLLTQFQGLAERFIETAQRGEFLGFTNLIDLLIQLHQGEVMDYPCGAGLGLFSVDPEGRLYLCQRFTGEDEFCMGDIFNGFHQEKLGKFREEAEISHKEDCQRCWVRTICTGGCYHEACVREGNHLKPNLHYCEWIKKWAELGLKAYARIAVTCPDYLDKLSMLRGHTPISNT